MKGGTVFLATFPSRILLLSALLLPLAACSSEKPASDREESPMNEQVRPEPAPEQNKGAESASTPSTASAPQPDKTRHDSQIPVSVQGRWGLVAADCTSKRGDAKGLLTIDSTSLRFYESVGELKGVRERDSSRIVGEFLFSGEGESWSRVMTLDAQDAGQTLIRRENGEGAAPGPLRYTRCKK